MATKQLIDDAKLAAAAKVTADEELAAATQTAMDASNSLAEKNQAVHADLTSNGVALYIEEQDGQQKYSLATPSDPASYTLTPIRVA